MSYKLSIIQIYECVMVPLNKITKNNLFDALHLFGSNLLLYIDN